MVVRTTAYIINPFLRLFNLLTPIGDLIARILLSQIFFRRLGKNAKLAGNIAVIPAKLSYGCGDRHYHCHIRNIFFDLFIVRIWRTNNDFSVLYF